MTKKIKVTMELSLKDIKIADELKLRLDARSRTAAISLSLRVTGFLSELIISGKEIFVKDKNGNVSQFYIVGLNDDS
jgi:hypothetical protein